MPQATVGASVPDDAKSVRLWRLVAIVATVAGLILRIGKIVTRDIWHDETFTWQVINSSFGGMVGEISRDVHPPLHYLISWIINQGSLDGVSPLYMRLGNLVWFVGLGMLAYWAACVPRVRVGFVSAFAVAAVAPSFVEIGAELRMYGLLLFLVAALLLSVHGVVQAPSLRNSVAAIALGIAASWTHYFGVNATASILAAALLVGGRQAVKRVMAIGAVTGLGVLALVPWLIPNLDRGLPYDVDVSTAISRVIQGFGPIGVILLVAAAVTSWRVRRQEQLRSKESDRPQSDRALSRFSTIALVSAALLLLTIAGWRILRGELVVNVGVSTVIAFMLLAGLLGIVEMPRTLLVKSLLVGGLVTVAMSAAWSWGSPNYWLGIRLSTVDVLDEVLRQYPTAGEDGGDGMLIIHIDWPNSNRHFLESAGARVPLAIVELGSPPEDGVVQRIIAEKGSTFNEIVVVRRPGTAEIDEVGGYSLRFLNRWAALYQPTGTR